MLLACVASAVLAAAIQRVGEDFLRKGRREEAAGGGRLLRASSWCAVAAGVLYGCYGPLVFHDFFLYRDGPVAHVSTLLVALPLVARGRSEEHEEISSSGDRGRSMRAAWGAFALGLLGGAATLVKQTVLPLALFSLYSDHFQRNPNPRAAAQAAALPAARSAAAACFSSVSSASLFRSASSPRATSRPACRRSRSTRGRRSASSWGNGFGADAHDEPATRDEGDPGGSGRLYVEDAKLVLAGYRQEPLELPKLFLKKLATFFNVFEVPDNANYYFFRDRLKILRILPVFPCVLGIGGVGICAALTRRVLRKEEGLLAFVGILTPLAACLLVQTTSRYRVAVAGPLALGAGLFLLFTLEEIRRHKWRAVTLLAAPAVVLSLVPLLPSTIYDARHRFSDMLVYATLAEAERGPEAAAEEIRRYVEEGGDDRSYDTALRALRYWVKSGRRSQGLVAPEGIAPPERRLRTFPKTSRDALFAH